MLKRFRGRSPTSPNVFRCHWYPLLQAGVFAFIALIGLAGLAKDPTIGGRVFGGVLAVVTSIFAVRGARAGTVVTTADSLVIRNLLWTHRVPYAEIQSVAAGDAARRADGLSQVVPRRRDTRRTAQGLHGVQQPPSRGDRRAVVEDVAAELDALVRRRVAGNS